MIEEQQRKNNHSVMCPQRQSFTSSLWVLTVSIAILLIALAAFTQFNCIPITCDKIYNSTISIINSTLNPTPQILNQTQDTSTLLSFLSDNITSIFNTSTTTPTHVNQNLSEAIAFVTKNTTNIFNLTTLPTVTTSISNISNLSSNTSIQTMTNLTTSINEYKTCIPVKCCNLFGKMPLAFGVFFASVFIFLVLITISRQSTNLPKQQTLQTKYGRMSTQHGNPGLLRLIVSSTSDQSDNRTTSQKLKSFTCNIIFVCIMTCTVILNILTSVWLLYGCKEQSRHDAGGLWIFLFWHCTNLLCVTLMYIFGYRRKDENKKTDSVNPQEEENLRVEEEVELETSV